jgi:hypothetical protein
VTRLAVLEREDLRYGLISESARHKAPDDLVCFTSREIAILRQHAARCQTPLPLPLEIVRAIVETKRALNGTIDDWDRQCASWQWTRPPEHATTDLDVAPQDEDGPRGVG